MVVDSLVRSPLGQLFWLYFIQLEAHDEPDLATAVACAFDVFTTYLRTTGNTRPNLHALNTDTLVAAAVWATRHTRGCRRERIARLLIGSLNGFCDWLVARGELGTNPLQPVPPPSRWPRLPAGCEDTWVTLRVPVSTLEQHTQRHLHAHPSTGKAHTWATLSVRRPRDQKGSSSSSN